MHINFKLSIIRTNFGQTSAEDPQGDDKGDFDTSKLCCENVDAFMSPSVAASSSMFTSNYMMTSCISKVITGRY